MQITDSFKDKKTLKCATYSSTISRIKEAFSKLGLKIKITTFNYNRKLGLYSAKIDIPELYITTYGKGKSTTAAIASGLGELAERFSANYFFISGNFLNTSNNNTNNFADLKKCTNLPGYIEGHQDEIPSAIKISKLISPLGDFSSKELELIKASEIAQRWVDGFSLISQKKVKVPLQFCEIISGSNGLAAGNKLEEAISQASHEIIERYTLIDIVKNRRIVPTFDNKTINNKTIQKTFNKMEKRGLQVYIKDFSLNNIFPSSMATLFYNTNISCSDYSSNWDLYSLNGGSSFNLYVGLTRCLSEKIAGSSMERFAKGLQKRLFEQYLNKLDFVHTTSNANYRTLVRKHWFGGDLSFLTEGEEVSFPTFEESYNYKTDFGRIVAICKKMKKDCIVVNLTHPVINFPVVRIIIPGLSDVIRFSIPTAAKLIKILKAHEQSAKFTASDNFTLKSTDWLQEKESILDVIRMQLEELVDNEFRTPIYNLLISKDRIKILLSLYYRIRDYQRFSVTCKYLAQCERNNWKYLYLHRMTEAFLKTKDQGIWDIVESFFESKMKGCERYLIAQPARNPFTTWCDKECKMQCEKKYLEKIDEIVDSFYLEAFEEIKRMSSDSTTQVLNES